MLHTCSYAVITPIEMFNMTWLYCYTLFIYMNVFRIDLVLCSHTEVFPGVSQIKVEIGS